MSDIRTAYPLFKAFRSGGFGQGYKLYTYTYGTSTANTCYKDKDLTIPHKNPIIMDSLGESEIFLSEPTKLVLKDADGTTLWTADDAAATSYAASDVTYDNSTSEYISTDVQSVIDEIEGEIDEIDPPLNRVLNSEMMIDQRNEGATLDIAAGGATSGFGVDRFLTSLSAGQLDLSVSREAGIGGYRNSLKIATDTKEDAWAAAEIVYPIFYRFLGYDVADLVAGATVTISFYFKSNAANNSVFSVALLSGDVGYSYVTDFTYTTSAADQFITKTITIPAHASNYISNTTTGVGLILSVGAFGGTNAQISPQIGNLNSWQPGSYYYSDSATDWPAEASGAGYVQISGLQFVVGSYTGQLGEKTRSDYLLECLPYYRKSFDQGVAPAQNSSDDNGALTYYAQEANTVDGIQVDFSAPMVGAPTVTLYNVDAANAKWRNATDGGDSGAATVVSAGLNGFAVSNASVATDGTGDKIYIHYSANAEIS